MLLFNIRNQSYSLETSCSQNAFIYIYIYIYIYTQADQLIVNHVCKTKFFKSILHVLFYGAKCRDT
jgi:hypothetical protein